MTERLHSRLAGFAAVLAFCVIAAGAWVRLSDAGLGCPDWPGCYGHLTWPQADAEITVADTRYPDRPVETPKAWKEMAHRYLAGALGLVVLGLAALALRRRRYEASARWRLPTAILALVLAQALFGMWTVTLKLTPLVVTAHLLGGILTFTLLVLHYRQLTADRAPTLQRHRPWLIAALLVLVGQIFLGGWTSTNYAALACPDFPTCQGQWWPEVDFSAGFTLLRDFGMDHEGGRLQQPARTAIHISHRLGALMATLIIGACALSLLRDRDVRATGVVLGGSLLVQISLGLANVLAKLPLANAVAHTAVAALLLAVLADALNRARSPSW